MENKNRALLKMIFSQLEKGDYKAFWSYFHEDAVWVVEGTHALAGKYNSLNEFKKSAFDRLQQVLASPVKYKVREVLADGSKGVVIMEGDSTTREGVPFHNRYCWIINIAANDKIDRVDAFFDTQLIHSLFTTGVR